MPTEQILGALAANGPMSILLGGIIFALWKMLKAKERALVALQHYYEGDPNDATGTKIGLRAQMQADALEREDGIRQKGESERKAERAENRELWAMVDRTLNKIAGDADASPA